MKTCAMCKRTICETEHLVLCRPDLLPEVWHEKTCDASGCRYFEIKDDLIELHLNCRRIVAEYYEGRKDPFIVIAFCDDGRRYSVDKGHVLRCRIAKWKATYYNYMENDVGFHRESLTGSEPLPMVVKANNQLD